MIDPTSTIWGWAPVWVVRWRARPGNRANPIDRIVVGGERSDVEAERADGVLLDVHAVETLQTGPATVYRRGSTHFPASAVDVLGVTDWPGAEPEDGDRGRYGDDESVFSMGSIPFDTVIGRLGHVISRASLRELGEHLHGLPTPLLRAFGETFAAECFRLDAPANALSARDDSTQGIDQSRSLASRLEVVVQESWVRAAVALGYRSAPSDPDVSAVGLAELVAEKVEERTETPFAPRHQLDAGTNASTWRPGQGRVRPAELETLPGPVPDAGPFSEQADMFDGGARTCGAFGGVSKPTTVGTRSASVWSSRPRNRAQAAARSSTSAR